MVYKVKSEHYDGGSELLSEYDIVLYYTKVFCTLSISFLYTSQAV